MKSMISFEGISALQREKGFRIGYLLMKLSALRRSIQYFLQMRKFSSSHSSVTTSNRVLSNTNWLKRCRMPMCTLIRSPVPILPPLPSCNSRKKEETPDFVWLMLYRAKLAFISSRILLNRSGMSILKLESRRCLSICSALRQERFRSGSRQDSSWVIAGDSCLLGIDGGSLDGSLVSTGGSRMLFICGATLDLAGGTSSVGVCMLVGGLCNMSWSSSANRSIFLAPTASIWAMPAR